MHSIYVHTYMHCIPIYTYACNAIRLFKDKVARATKSPQWASGLTKSQGKATCIVYVPTYNGRVTALINKSTGAGAPPEREQKVCLQLETVRAAERSLVASDRDYSLPGTTLLSEWGVRVHHRAVAPTRLRIPHSDSIVAPSKLQFRSPVVVAFIL